MDARDVAEAKHAPADCEVDIGYVLFGLKAPETLTEMDLVARLNDAGWPDDVLRLQRRDQGARSMPRLASSCIEKSMKICSSCAPRISILETSWTLSSCERTSST